MSSFERMWSKLPECLQSDDIKKYYMGISEIFDMLEKEQEKDVYTSVLSKLEGKALDAFGECEGVKRFEKDDLNFKKEICIQNFSRNMIPTIDSITKLVDIAAGNKSYVQEGWEFEYPENCALKLRINSDDGVDFKTFKKISEKCGDGVKVVFEVIYTKKYVNTLSCNYAIHRSETRTYIQKAR